MRARNILDPSFEARLTPALLPYAFLFLVAATGLAGLAVIVGAFTLAWWLGLIALAAVPVAVAGIVAVIRIFCELVLALALMSDDTKAMAAGLSRVESTVDGVASDMPRLGFLRLTPGSRRPTA